ncbi:MAG: hypothetical protein U9R54_10045 [Bacteroidota bacterium]|nr:hypothetical protein [Bacteroidota bacterium]
MIILIEIIESYIFPKFLTKNLMKRVYEIGFVQMLGRIRINTIGLIFGF